MNEKLLLHMAKQLLMKPDGKHVGIKQLQAIAQTGDLTKLKLALKDVAEQATDPKSEASTRQGFGDNLVNIALALFPNLPTPPPLYEDKVDVIPGGKADNLTPQDIANKFGVSLEKIESEIAMGIPVETEHTKDKGLAREIALDHLSEFPDYYTRLNKLEKNAKKVWDENIRKRLRCIRG